jgi:hypothetical protein
MSCPCIWFTFLYPHDPETWLLYWCKKVILLRIFKIPMYNEFKCFKIVTKIVYWFYSICCPVSKLCVRIFNFRFSLQQNTHTPFLGRKSTGGMKATAHLCLVLRLRMNGAIHLLLPYAFMLCTGTALLCFTLSCFTDIKVCVTVRCMPQWSKSTSVV